MKKLEIDYSEYQLTKDEDPYVIKVEFEHGDADFKTKEKFTFKDKEFFEQTLGYMSHLETKKYDGLNKEDMCEIAKLYFTSGDLSQWADMGDFLNDYGYLVTDEKHGSEYATVEIVKVFVDKIERVIKIN